MFESYLYVADYKGIILPEKRERELFLMLISTNVGEISFMVTKLYFSFTTRSPAISLID